MAEAALAISAGIGLLSAVQSGDANSKANSLAASQQDQETTLLNQATAQAEGQKNADNSAINSATTKASMNALQGNNFGFNSTVLTGNGVGPSTSGAGIFQPGKTLLG
jgi:hypothetical protein